MLPCIEFALKTKATPITKPKVQKDIKQIPSPLIQKLLFIERYHIFDAQIGWIHNPYYQTHGLERWHIDTNFWCEETMNMIILYVD